MATSTSALVSAPRAPLAVRREAAHSVPRELRCDLPDYVDGQLLNAERELRHGSDRHGGIHEARKSLRKARAALLLARGGLGDAGCALDRDLAALCRSLSALRDAQAITETLVRLAQQGGPEEVMWRAALPFAVVRRDALLVEALEQDPGFAAIGAQLHAFRLRAEQLDWRGVTGFDVVRGHSRSEENLLTAYLHALAHPTEDEAWHRVRRRLRRLRHQSALLSGSSPMLQSARFDERVSQLLGEAQDEHVLLDACGRHSPFPASMRRELRVSLRKRIRRTRKSARRSRHPV